MINTDITAADVNSYASEDDLRSFAELRAIELPEKLAPLLTKAMDYLEGLDWVGSKADPRQPLAWPRVNVILDGHDFPPDQVPRTRISSLIWLVAPSFQVSTMPEVE